MTEPVAGDRIDRAVERLAFATAMAGGVALVAVVLLTTASVTGRSLARVGLAPVPGDYELVEVLTAFAVCACLGWCQLRRGHVRVDLPWQRAPRRLVAAVDVVVDGLMTLAAAILAWRLAAGMVDRARFGETTFVLQLPLAWAYGACLLGLVVFVLAASLSLRRSLRRVRRP